MTDNTKLPSPTHNTYNWNATFYYKVLPIRFRKHKQAPQTLTPLQQRSSNNTNNNPYNFSQ